MAQATKKPAKPAFATSKITESVIKMAKPVEKTQEKALAMGRENGKKLMHAAEWFSRAAAGCAGVCSGNIGAIVEPVPLGYEVKERKLLIVPADAQNVRLIYQRYMELGCVRLLRKDITAQGIRSVSGKVFSRGALYKMLSNPIYIGQIRHKGICHPGQHEAIIDQVVWEQVQRQLADNRIGNKTCSRKTDPCPLTDKLFDVSGERLVPVHALKKGRRYRYYVSQSLTIGPSEGWRLPGQDIEQVVAHAAAQMLHDDHAITTALQESNIEAHRIPAVITAAGKIKPDAPCIIDRFIQRVEVRQDGIRLRLSLAPLIASGTNANAITITRDIPMQMKRRGVEMRLTIGGVGPARVDQTLLKTIIRAHKWFNELISGQAQSMVEIASREGIDKSYVARIMNLVFLAPDITESIIAGYQPPDISVEKLTKRIDLPMDWVQQRQLLGFS